MLKNELTFDVIKVLKETADRFQSELFQRVRSQLNGRDIELLDYVFERYYPKDEKGGRWYDPYHILFSTHFAVQLVKTNERVSPLIIPSIISHDVGYITLSEEMKENWNAAQNRILHMQEGAAITAESLVYIGGYKASETGIIVRMVGGHDNGYLDIETRDPDCLALRDADRIWVMHFVSFYKDWISKSKQQKDISLQSLYGSRWDRLFNETNLFFHTSLAKQWRDRQFAARWQEIQSDILKDENSFRQYVEQHIQSELAAGRG